ncbi:hypothetical protein BGE01nite_14590 [Brevifollis gellanilyticus]|uniref:7-cyano-7-deazaguanine synthase n=1 Tax=Brevifollis gellanilyticus TaxID=748831 RepID=A0A512M604_9BACT|nr:hypothetical protein BGE01nite_14590 [Brevifollis gellanilyticus]
MGAKEDENVLLRIEDLKRSFYRDIEPQYLDLVEIAAYVYAADQATTRCFSDADRFGEDWRRDFHFHIPVRATGLWKSQEVISALTNLLTFLSDDYFTFHFSQSTKPNDLEQQYLEFDNESHDGRPIDKVVMFSGGLDSLAGAMEEILTEKNRIVLVTHLSTPKNNGFLASLKSQIADKAGQAKPHHVRVRANKQKRLGKEYTQRTRSFLFASFGATIARMLNIDSLRFYENGVVSLNLPLSAQVVGSRATRTTHPKVLSCFERLFSAIGGGGFKVENPFFQDTKAGVIRRLVALGCSDMLQTSISCAHTWERTKQHTHCGLCSQCIDRRIAMVAAAAVEYDPLDRYARNIFIDDRPKDEDKMMLAGYLDRATKAAGLKGVADLLIAFPQVVDALPHIPGGNTKAAERVFDLHKRHAEEVGLALGRLVAAHCTDVAYGRLGRGSLLRAMTDNVGIDAAVELKAKETTVAQTQLEPSNAELSIQMNEGFKSVLAHTTTQQQLLDEVSSGALAFLKSLSQKLTSKQHQLFVLLVETVSGGGAERHLSYDEIAMKLCKKGKKPISKQAVWKQVEALKAQNPRLKLFIENARQRETSSNFSELSPTQRRKSGIDESYDHRPIWELARLTAWLTRLTP